MNNFVKIDKFKEDLIKLEDKIIEEKSYLYEQLIKLENEETLIKQNIQFFQKYLNTLEGNENNNKTSILQENKIPNTNNAKTPHIESLMNSTYTLDDIAKPHKSIKAMTFFEEDVGEEVSLDNDEEEYIKKFIKKNI
jgi:hypothetical protein